MKKSHQLRETLVNAFVDYQHHPENLIIQVPRGNIEASLGDGIHHEHQRNAFLYRYELVVVFLEFVGNPDHLFTILVNWLKTHQSDLLENPTKRAQDFQFSVEFIDNSICDISVSLKLTESISVTEKADGWDIVNKSEPEHVVFVRYPDPSYQPHHRIQEKYSQ